MYIYIYSYGIKYETFTMYDIERVSTAEATFIITSNFASDLLILPDFVLKYDSISKEDLSSYSRKSERERKEENDDNDINSKSERLEMDHHSSQTLNQIQSSSSTLTSSIRLNYHRAADRADILFNRALNSLDYDSEGRRNPFKRAETRGRVDVFANLYPYHETELFSVVESALYQAIRPFEAKYPNLIICWTPEAINEFSSRY